VSTILTEDNRIQELDQYELDSEGKPLHFYLGLILNTLKIMWANARYLLARTLVVMAVSLGILFLQPNRYTATVYMNPPDMNALSGLSLMIAAKTGGLAVPGLSGQMGDLLGLRSPGQVYIRQLQTGVVEDELIDQFDLPKVYKTKTRLQTRRALESATTFDEDRKSGVVGVSVTDKDPNRAAQMANAYAERLGMLLAKMSANAGRREREYFETQLDAAQAELDRASRQLSEFGSKNAALDVTEEGKALVDNIAAIQGQLIAAQSELQGLLQVYTESNVRVRQARASISLLKQQLAEMMGKRAQQTADVSTHPDPSSKAGTGDITQDANVRRLWGLATPYMDLYRRVKVQEAVVENLTEQFEIAKLQEAHLVSSVEVLDPARPPEKKSGPHRATDALMIGFLTFVLLSGIVIAKDRWYRTPPDDPYKQLLQPVVDEAVDVQTWVKLRTPIAQLRAIKRARHSGQSIEPHADGGR
jgi:uncharacterized protein involved in exopolysaccharide biosynthesis